MISSFIKNPDILIETHEVEDLLDFSEIRKDFKRFLENIDESSLVGLIGKFGTGKSTMLHQLNKKSEEGEKWVLFDAWKFPERNDLWEGFVLDLVRSLDSKAFQKIRRKIDGKSSEDKQLLIKVLSEGANIFLPGAGVIKNLSNLFHSSPAKRVFEFQEILEDFLNNNCDAKCIYIVIEDIDRSGDKGIYFLETLKNFFRNANINKKIIGIVAVGDTSFNENKESYLKSLDYLYQFQPKNIDFSNFIDQVFDDTDIAQWPWIEQLSYLFRNLVGSERMTIREIKNLLRNTYLKYQALSEVDKKNIDIRTMLAFAVVAHQGKRLNVSRNNRRIFTATDSPWLINYMMMLAHGDRDVKAYKTGISISFTNNANLKIPKFDSMENGYFLSDVYLGLFSL